MSWQDQFRYGMMSDMSQLRVGNELEWFEYGLVFRFEDMPGPLTGPLRRWSTGPHRYRQYCTVCFPLVTDQAPFH
jgi:hypothetical protein